jgi:3-methyladenine DNA glycosylase AlkD
MNTPETTPPAVRLADQLEAELRAVGTPERAQQERRYLKSQLTFLGASVPKIRAAAKRAHRANPDLDRAQLHDLIEELWRRGIHECRMAAVELLDAYGRLLSVDDLPLVERLLRESGTWALVDGLAGLPRTQTRASYAWLIR